MSKRIACPFCGSSNLDIAKDDPWRRIRCLNCNAIGPSGFKGPSFAVDNSYSETLWDTRVPIIQTNKKEK